LTILRRFIIAARRRAAVLVALAALPALTAPVEEIPEQLIQLRIVGQLRHRAVVRLDVLGGRDIDHRVDDFFRDIRDSVGSARQRRRDEDG